MQSKNDINTLINSVKANLNKIHNKIAQQDTALINVINEIEQCAEILDLYGYKDINEDLIFIVDKIRQRFKRDSVI